MCNDGKNRRGQILVSYTGSYFAQGSAGTITQGNGAVTCSQVAPTIGEYYEGTFYYNGATQVYNTITTTGVNLTGSFRLKRKQ